MEAKVKKFMSPHRLSQQYGIPENKIRKDIKRGVAPGFYSGTWFHVDVEAYIGLLTQKNMNDCEE